MDITSTRRAYPNLALMKLSSYHKARGDDVFLNFPLCQPDISYASCVFTWNSKKRSIVDAHQVGGSGIDLGSELHRDIEHLMPDYSLYPGYDFSLGFTSRGCNRRCPWCIVPKKEGNIKPWARIYEFWDRRHKRITLLDNNTLAAPNWRETMNDLTKENLQVDFNQGLDIRLLDDERAFYLSKVRAKTLRFSFDDIAYEPAVRKGVGLLKKLGVSSRKLSFYVLSGFKEDDSIIERMLILKDLNVDVFPMVYKGPDGKEPARRLIYKGDEKFHGSRGNIDKFLRTVGRLPE